MTELLLPFACKSEETELFVNAKAARRPEWGARQEAVLTHEGFRLAEAVIRHWPGYRPTPLLSLKGLAAQLGLGALWYKDEARRFELKSFKALGGTYAIAELILRRAAKRAWAVPVSSPLLFVGRYRELAQSITVCCASHGNHGCSVAWGARMFGCKAVVFTHSAVSAQRRDAIAALGAEVRVAAGNYDHAVEEAAREAQARRWTVISDTSSPRGNDIPKDVMQGYGVMAAEAIGALPPEERLTHVFVQSGAGAMAAAVAAHLTWRWGRRRPKLVVVEPRAAACLAASARAGRIERLKGELDTVMANLACGTPSALAFDILDDMADAYLTLPDEAAIAAMRLLASGQTGDPVLVAGASGAAGLAAAVVVAGSARLKAALELDTTSRVLVFGTEGASDPKAYHDLVGRPFEDVERLRDMASFHL